jgi:hypothetical protein
MLTPKGGFRVCAVRDARVSSPAQFLGVMGAMFVKARRISLGGDKAIDDILGELDLPF